MARKKSNFKKTPKPNILDFLKGMTTWLCTNNPSQEDLEKLLKKFPDVNINFVFNKIMSYNITYPHIIWYANKYLNNFYDFSALSSNKVAHYENKIRLINTLKNLMDINFQSHRNKLFYLKSKDLKDENRGQIKKLINEYFITIFNKQYNDKELDFFYTLFEKGHILEEELYKIDETLHNGKKTLKLNMTTTGFENYEIKQKNILTPRQYLEYCRKRELAAPIVSYCHELITIKKDRQECITCQLYKKPMVILDTNMEQLGPIDVMFVGLNPGRDEVTYNKTFIGDPSIILREKIMKFHPNTKWMITNIIMCHTPNEKGLGEWEPVAANCAKQFLTDVVSKFQPKVFVTIGRQSKEFFKVPGLISKVSGQIFDHGKYKIIPLIHPSSVARSRDRNGAIFENSWKNIYQGVEDLPVNIPCEDQQIPLGDNIQSECTIFLNSENMIKEITDDLMLFDIVNLDNEKILQIFIDSKGKKKYKTIEYKVPIFIKHSSNWSHNNMITDKVDSMVEIIGKNRYYVNKLLKDQLEEIKNT